MTFDDVLCIAKSIKWIVWSQFSQTTKTKWFCKYYINFNSFTAKSLFAFEFFHEKIRHQCYQAKSAYLRLFDWHSHDLCIDCQPIETHCDEPHGPLELPQWNPSGYLNQIVSSFWSQKKMKFQFLDSILESRLESRLESSSAIRLSAISKKKFVYQFIWLSNSNLKTDFRVIKRL